MVMNVFVFFNVLQPIETSANNNVHIIAYEI